jgi:hypothetical protein
MADVLSFNRDAAPLGRPQLPRDKCHDRDLWTNSDFSKHPILARAELLLELGGELEFFDVGQRACRLGSTVESKHLIHLIAV